ncbi:MAG TPA: hypothetical protein VGP72_17840 [Planctomycetota bacterium]|jgi:hypothetical protein
MTTAPENLKLAAGYCTLLVVVLGLGTLNVGAADAPAESNAKPSQGTTAEAAKDSAAAAKAADSSKKDSEPAKKPGEKAEEKSTSWSSKTGVQLWSQGCKQCHNIRSPSTLSYAEWSVAASWMRYRCNLTAKEYRKIAAILKGEAEPKK